MNKRWWWLFLVLAAVAVVGLILSSCGPSTPSTPSTPTGTPSEWVPEVPGMKPGEDKLYYNWLWGDPSAKIADTDWKTWFVDEWAKRTNGHMKVQMRYAGQLGSAVEAPGLVASGVVQIMYVSPSYHLAEMPLSQLSIIPLWATARDNPENSAKDAAVLQNAIHLHSLAKAEFARLNLIMTNHTGQLPGYNLLVRMGKQLDYDEKGYLKNGVEQFKGLILRAPGFYAQFAQALGMGTVLVTAGEHYEGMQKGLMDINPLGVTSMMSNKLWEVTDRYNPTSLGWGSAGEVMNLQTWNSLPQYIKDVYNQLIVEANDIYRTKNLAYLKKAQDFVDSKGVPKFYIDDAGWAKINAAAGEAYKAWREHVIKMYKGDATVFNTYFRDMVALRNQLTTRRGEPAWDIFLPAGLGDVSKPYSAPEPWYPQFMK